MKESSSPTLALDIRDFVCWCIIVYGLPLLASCIQKKSTTDRSAISNHSSFSGETGGVASKDGFEATLPSGISSQTLNVHIDPLKTAMKSPDGLTSLATPYLVSVTNLMGARITDLEKAVEVNLTVPLMGVKPEKTDFYAVLYDSLSLSVKKIIRASDVTFAFDSATVKISLAGDLNFIFQVALALTSGQLPVALWQAEAKILGLAVTNLSRTSAVVSWNPLSSGIGFTNYAVSIQKDSTIKNPVVSDATLCSTLASDYPKISNSVQFSALAPDTNYHITVCAKKSEAGQTLYSLPTSLNFTTLSPAVSTNVPVSTDAENPTNPLATADSFQQITLTWGSGGDLTASYVVAYQSGASAPTNCTLGTLASTSSTSLVISGLAAATQYSFRVCARNSSGVVSSLGGVTATGTTSAAPPLVSGWTHVDGDGANGINRNVVLAAESPQFTAFNSKLYVTWIEKEVSNGFKQLRVAVYKETSPYRAFVDGDASNNGLNQSPALDTSNPQLTVFNGKLYLTWAEVAGSGRRIHVNVYNGNDSSPSWQRVDGAGGNAFGLNMDQDGVAKRPKLKVFNSKLYAIWEEGIPSSFKVRVKVYNGNDSAPAWTFVDGNNTSGINKTPNSALTCNLEVFNSKLYAIWSELGTTQDQVRVAVYNGNDSSASWTFIDGNGADGMNKDTTEAASAPQMAVFNSKLYAIWKETISGGVVDHVIRAAVYNGNDTSPSWSFIDGSNGLNKEVHLVASDPQLSVFGSTLYATWQEYDNSSVTQIRVAAYGGNDTSPSWTFVDGNGASGINKAGTLGAVNPQLTLFNSKLYATWTDILTGVVGQIRIVLAN